MTGETRPKRPWTTAEERYVWQHRYSLSAREMGMRVHRTGNAVILKLRELREDNGKDISRYERRAVTEEVCKYLVQLVVSRRITQADAVARARRLSRELDQPAGIIAQRAHWSVSRWLEHLGT